jgi:hypothetical protein
MAVVMVLTSAWHLLVIRSGGLDAVGVDAPAGG